MNKLEIVVLYAIVAIALGCTLATEALRGLGLPVGGASEAARVVDEAIGGWLRDLFLFGAGAGTTEGARVAVKVHKKRKAAKAAATH